MDKASILAELTKSGEISVFRRSPTWEKAFELYNKTTGERLSPNCSSCFKKVSAWLRA